VTHRKEEEVRAMTAAKTRTERDSMGALEVPTTALYGAQTQRAVQNFPISGMTMPRQFIYAITLIKEAAAGVNAQLGLLDANVAEAIQQAARAVRAGEHDAQFPVDVFQTGSGTSTNMNVNEVLATLASRARGTAVSANDHVNMGQSSNDVIPTAIHVAAALALKSELLPALEHLAKTIERRARQLARVTKTGRTHLMDAMPLTLGQELGGWAAQIRSGIARVSSVLPRLHALPQGGTAVGTGINAHRRFADKFATALGRLTRIKFRSCDNFFEGLSAQDTAVELSGQLKVVAVSIMKIANDLRWMNSGPLSGIGEIELPALQPGSSIMPGKVNPVIPEAAAMVSARVIGNDTAITLAGQSGNFQLNVMLPLIAHDLLQTIQLLASVSRLLADKAIRDFSVRRENIDNALARNPILVTALNPIIGYAKAAEIAKRAYTEKRMVIDVAEEMTDLPRGELERLLDPTALTSGGLQNPA
jgi:fumarate hydratase, class II